MRWGAQLLAASLATGLAVLVQAAQQPEPAAPQGQPQQQERPTLGPRNGPALEAGPLTSTTTDIKKLLRIHTIYIENIDNALSDKLVETLGKSGRFRLVTKQKEADAVLRGSCLESRHLKRVHTEVFISDRNGTSVWQDSIMRPYNPPALDQAVKDTAGLVAAHLDRTIREADRR